MRTNFSKRFSLTLVALAGFWLLAACGDSPTNTAAPAAATSTPVIAPTAATGQAAPGGSQMQMPVAQVVTGTVESYDAASKMLSVKSSDGQSQKFAIGTTQVVKAEKLSTEDFGKQAGGNNLVMVTGDKGSDGSYNAKQLVVVDAASMGGGPAGAGGMPAGMPSFPAGGTPPAGMGAGMPGSNLGIVAVRGGTLSGTKFSGNSLTGEPVTVNLSSTTSLTKQVNGSLDDLKAGTNVSLNFIAAQGQTAAQVIRIVVG